MVDKVSLNIISLDNFILSHEELAKQLERGIDPSANLHSFMADFNIRKLDRYFGAFVAYHKGIFAGQSTDRDTLYASFSAYHGDSSLAVFQVPNSILDRPDLTQARGWFGQQNKQ